MVQSYYRGTLIVGVVRYCRTGYVRFSNIYINSSIMMYDIKKTKYIYK